MMMVLQAAVINFIKIGSNGNSSAARKENNPPVESQDKEE
jgi:hypothetical protein